MLRPRHIARCLTASAAVLCLCLPGASADELDRAALDEAMASARHARLERTLGEALSRYAYSQLAIARLSGARVPDALVSERAPESDPWIDWLFDEERIAQSREADAEYWLLRAEQDAMDAMVPHLVLIAPQPGTKKTKPHYDTVLAEARSEALTVFEARERAELEARQRKHLEALGRELATAPKWPSSLRELPGGDVVIDDPEGSRELVLRGVTRLEGTLIVEGAPALERLVLPDLESLGGLDVSFNPALVAIEAPRLRRVQGAVRLRDNARLNDLQLPVLEAVRDRLELIGNASLVRVELPSLSTLESLYVEDNPRLSACVVDALATATGGVRITGNQRLERVALGALVTVLGDLDVLDNVRLAALEIASLEAVDGALTVALNDQLTVLRAGSLQRIGGGFSLAANSSLGAMELGGLRTVGGRLELSEHEALAPAVLDALRERLEPSFEPAVEHVEP